LPGADGRALRPPGPDDRHPAADGDPDHRHDAVDRATPPQGAALRGAAVSGTFPAAAIDRAGAALAGAVGPAARPARGPHPERAPPRGGGVRAGGVGGRKTSRGWGGDPPGPENAPLFPAPGWGFPPPDRGSGSLPSPAPTAASGSPAWCRHAETRTHGEQGSP